MASILRTNETHSPRTPSAPRGKRAYVIGDVHGCLKELAALIDLIKSDLSSSPKKDDYIIFLGDLIDRGPSSREVIDYVLNMKSSEFRLLFVKGNHEDSLVKGLKTTPQLLNSWLRHGGFATAESYGVPRSHLVGQSIEAIAHILTSSIPRNHVQFLDSFVDYIIFGDYFCVHAGINPDYPLDQQTSRDLKWIRQPFLNSKLNYPKVIVHGHTIVPKVEIHHNRIAVDTGAYETGTLSAVKLEGVRITPISI